MFAELHATTLAPMGNSSICRLLPDGLSRGNYIMEKLKESNNENVEKHLLTTRIRAISNRK